MKERPDGWRENERDRKRGKFFAVEIKILVLGRGVLETN